MSQTPPPNPLPPQLPPPLPAPPGLSPEQIAELGLAAVRKKKLNRAIGVATMDAWITAVFAVGAILTSCGGIDQMAIGAALAWVTFNSFRGRGGLKRFERAAPMRLAINQLVLASAVTLYAAYQLWELREGKSAILNMLVGGGDLGELGSAGKSLDDLNATLLLTLRMGYLALIVGTLVTQGLTALYYRSRLKVLDAYLAETPQWVIDFQKAQRG